MYSTRSVGSCFQGTRRSVGQSFSLGRLHHRPQGPAPWFQGAGRESNLLSHVLHHGSRVCLRCIKRTDEVVARDMTKAAEALRYATAQCAGGTCTHITGLMYSEPAVGLYSMGDEVLAREVGCGLVNRDSVSSAPRSHSSDPIHVLRPAVALLFLTKAQRGCYRDVHLTGGCSPGRQLGFLLRPPNEVKGSDGIIVTRM